MRFVYDMYKYLLVVHKDITEDYFLKKSGAVSGYALQFFQRLWNSIFQESDDVHALYENYYWQEYENYYLFLEGYYGLENATVEDIKDVLTTNPDYKLIDYSSLDYGENFDDLISSEDLHDRFEKILLMAL